MRFTGEEPTLELSTTTPLDVVSCTSPLSGYYADAFSFIYIVSPGDYTLDLSYSSTTAFALSDSTEVVDASGVPANVTLPEVGSSLSVTGGEDWEEEGALVVDTSNVVLYVTSLNGDGTYYAGESVFLQVGVGLRF